MSLGFQLVLAIVLGSLCGAFYGVTPFFFGISTATLGTLGFLVIRMLKALAVPLIFFAILESIPKITLTKKQVLSLMITCLVNVSVAMMIGLCIMHFLQPGLYWAHHFPQFIAQLKGNTTFTPSPYTISPIVAISGFIPETIISPFLSGSVIPVVLLALLFSLSLRHFLHHAEDPSPYRQILSFCTAGFQLLLKCLEWVIRLIPYAVFGMVAHTVGKTSLAVYGMLWIFPVVLISGLALHSLFYYPFIIWFLGQKSPLLFFKHGSDAILTGFSTNSSLATVPVTLKALKSMGVSDDAARLSACIGTNLNNDGIALYEAMAAIFILQAFGIPVSLSTQLIIVGTSVLAGWGIAGIPEAGLVMLPIVLANTALPPEWIAAIIPFIIPVDWLIARCRSAVNVMSDMTVGIIVDRFK